MLTDSDEQADYNGTYPYAWPQMYDTEIQLVTRVSEDEWRV
jgi:hypothetical protein